MDDYNLAKKIQAALNAGTLSLNQNKDNSCDSFKNRPDLNSTMNIAHPDWEFLDPTPDIHCMFGAFDLKFFQGKLQCVQLEWSKRMYSCAGICYSRKNRYGIQCTIRLSEPLLKLRSRKNLVETLLHEMIHAYLFVLGIREENGGHGPNFKRKMSEINSAAGTNITVYHTFYDEVQNYKQHWWRCNGICQHRRPFFGYVRRTSNRAPGPNDRWWKQHHDTCSGTFEKIKEPEKTAKKASNKTAGSSSSMPKGEIKANNVPSIRNFFDMTKTPPNRTGLANRGGNTLVIRTPEISKNRNNTSTAPTNKKNNTQNLGNVVSLKDFDEDRPPNSDKSKNISLFSGTGQSLSSIGTSQSKHSTVNNTNVQRDIRNIWNKRYDASSESEEESKKKKSKITEINIDDDLILVEHNHTVINLSDSDDEIPIKKLPKQSSKELRDIILEEIKEEDSDDIITFLDDDYNDNILNESQEVLDAVNFGATSSSVQIITSDKINCPLCQESMLRIDLSAHLEGCMGVQVSVKPLIPNYKKQETTENKRLPFYKRKSKVNEFKSILSDAGYNEQEIVAARDDSSDNYSSINISNIEDSSSNIQTNICPVCNTKQSGDINEHLDVCLTNNFD